MHTKSQRLVAMAPRIQEQEVAGSHKTPVVVEEVRAEVGSKLVAEAEAESELAEEATQTILGSVMFCLINGLYG